jgi:hypothetical protein
MSDQGAQPEPSSEPPEWLAGIEGRMDELANQQYEIAQQFQDALSERPVYAEPEEAPEEGLPEEEWYDDDGELTPQAAEQIIDQRVDERVSERLSEQLGLRDAAAQVQARDEAYEDLVAEFPDLDEVGPDIVTDLVRELTEAGRAEVIEHPVFVDLVEARYKASLYDRRSNEAPSDEVEPRRGVMLEAAGGGSPTRGREEQEDWQARIVEAARAVQPDI